MARRKKKRKIPKTRIERILARPKPAIGTFPGMNRSRKFRIKKHYKNKYKCRGRVKDE